MLVTLVTVFVMKGSAGRGSSAAPVHGDNCVDDEKNHEIVQDPPRAEAEQGSHVKVHDDGGSKNEDEVTATDTDDEGQRMAQEVEAKLAVQPAEAEEAKETNKEGRLGRGAKKAAAKGAIVPVDDEPEGVNKKAEKAAVVPVDDETDGEVVAPAGGDQAPVAAPVASEEAAAGKEPTTKCDKEHACEEKAHEE